MCVELCVDKLLQVDVVDTSEDDSYIVFLQADGSEISINQLLEEHSSSVAFVDDSVENTADAGKIIELNVCLKIRMLLQLFMCSSSYNYDLEWKCYYSYSCVKEYKCNYSEDLI